VGIAVTGDYQFTKRFNLGGGFQVCRFRPTITNKNEFIPSLYGDLRLNSVMRKKHFFFYFMDLGMNFYTANDNHSSYNALFDHVPKNDGFYTGLGVGYFRRITKHGGPYVSLKLMNNIYKDLEYDYVANKQHTALIDDGNAALCIGFKF
jgi:hypothetical protein